MKKFILFSISSFLLLVGFSIYYLAPVLELGSLWVSSTPLDGEGIDEVHLGDELDTKYLTEKYGTFGRINNDFYKEFLDFESLRIASDKNNRIVLLSSISSQMTTRKGIRVGDSTQDVIQAYGPNYFIGREQGNNKIVYLDRKKNIRLEFWEYNDQVVSIRMMAEF
jgi:hypothetical protein